VAMAEVAAAGSVDGPVYLASGTDYPDGLAVAALAAHTNGVLVLTDGGRLPDATARYLAAHGDRPVIAVGGPARTAATSAGILHTSIVGRNRYDTAAQVSGHFSDGTTTAAGLASGTNWPDALVGAAVMGHVGGPLLLTPSDRLDAATSTAAARLGTNPDLDSAYVFGGDAAVRPGTAEAFSSALTTASRASAAGSGQR